MASFTAQEIATRLGGQLTGPADLLILGVDQLDAAGPDQISFIRDHHHAAEWAAGRAGAALVTRGVEVKESPGRALIVVNDADLALAQVLELFAPPPPRPAPAPGIHPAAQVDPTATVEPGCFIGAFVFIGPGVRIGAGCVIHANVSIMDQSVVGPGCVLYPGVAIRERCELGARCILHPNVVIGSDGFNYRPSPDGRGVIKIPQIGTVRLGNDVEIGSCTCVDRAKFSATVIGDGTKIDNLCQIAHNVRIGRSCVIAGQVGIAGSCTVGDGVMMGGATVIRDHVKVGNGARIAGAAVVGEDVPPGATWAGYPAKDATAALREMSAVRRLPDLMRTLRERGKK